MRVYQNWVYSKWTCESLPNLRESLPKVSVWEFTETVYQKRVRVYQNWERVYQKGVCESSPKQRVYQKWVCESLPKLRMSVRIVRESLPKVNMWEFTKSECVRVHQNWEFTKSECVRVHQNWEFTKKECVRVYPNKTWHPCFWKIYRNALLSHSCKIDLAPPVSERLPKETDSEPSNKTGSTKSGVSCLCMLTGWSWPVHQSQRHVHCSYLIEWLDVLHPLLVLQCVLLVLLVVLGEQSKWLHVLTLVFHVLQGQQNITVMS